jgi:Na+/melibiose symporter-like transporter
MLVLALAAGGAALIAFYSTDFVKQHPLRLLGVPAFGMIVFFICAKIDQYRERALPQASQTSTLPIQWQSSPATIVRLATWCAVLLAFSLLTIPFSLYGELFGPKRGIFLAIVAFLLSLLVFFQARQTLGLRFLKECPAGLSTRFPELAKWRKHIERLLIPLGLLVFLSLAVMFICGLGAGGPADTLPVFAPREHYVLNNHSKRTEVSPLRFWLAGGGGLIAWHCGALFASLLALYGLSYGEFPPQFKRDFPNNRNPKNGKTE